MNAFQRKFVNEVRRCDEMERKLKYFEREINKDEIPVLDTGESPEAPPPREMIDLEVSLTRFSASRGSYVLLRAYTIYSYSQTA